jgi:sugar phosphate isomerase/epimerase
MIEIGCQSYSLRARPGVDMLESARKMGFRAVELWVGHADYAGDPGSAGRMRRAAERIGLAIPTYCAGGLVRESPATVAERLARAFDYAGEVGATLLTGVVDRRALEIVDALCGRTGLRFAVENHWYAEFARADDYAALAGCSTLVGVTLDTGHLVVAGDDPLEALARLGPRLMNVHLKDVAVAGPVRRLVWRVPRMEGRTLGTGAVPVAAFLGALVTGGYTGAVAIEDERPELPLSELQAALRLATGLVRDAARAQAKAASAVGLAP